jgi:hypothetical protein
VYLCACLPSVSGIGTYLVVAPFLFLFSLSLYLSCLLLAHVDLFVCEQRKRIRSTLMITALHHLSNNNKNNVAIIIMIIIIIIIVVVVVVARMDDYQFLTETVAIVYLAYKHFIKQNLHR